MVTYGFIYRNRLPHNLSTIQYNTISFIGKAKKVKVSADTAATWDHYTIGLHWNLEN